MTSRSPTDADATETSDDRRRAARADDAACRTDDGFVPLPLMPNDAADECTHQERLNTLFDMASLVINSNVTAVLTEFRRIYETAGVPNGGFICQ